MPASSGLIFVELRPSMKVPPKRKGNSKTASFGSHVKKPSMKVPPKRKGNRSAGCRPRVVEALNESPSEKEGKSDT